MIRSLDTGVGASLFCIGNSLRQFRHGLHYPDHTGKGITAVFGDNHCEKKKKTLAVDHTPPQAAIDSSLIRGDHWSPLILRYWRGPVGGWGDRDATKKSVVWSPLIACCCSFFFLICQQGDHCQKKKKNQVLSGSCARDASVFKVLHVFLFFELRMTLAMNCLCTSQIKLFTQSWGKKTFIAVGSIFGALKCVFRLLRDLEKEMKWIKTQKAISHAIVDAEKGSATNEHCYRHIHVLVSMFIIRAGWSRRSWRTRRNTLRQIPLCFQASSAEGTGESLPSRLSTPGADACRRCGRFLVLPAKSNCVDIGNEMCGSESHNILAKPKILSCTSPRHSVEPRAQCNHDWFTCRIVQYLCVDSWGGGRGRRQTNQTAAGRKLMVGQAPPSTNRLNCWVSHGPVGNETVPFVLIHGRG